MDNLPRNIFWKAALIAAKVGSEGAFPIKEDDFYSLCEEQFVRLKEKAENGSIEIHPLELTEDILKNIVKKILGFFVALSHEPEQETRFNEIIAELDQCQSSDDYEEFLISLNIFMNFFQSAIDEMARDREVLQSLLFDFASSINLLQDMGKDFLNRIEQFQTILKNIDNTQTLEELINQILEGSTQIIKKGDYLSKELYEINHHTFKLQTELEKRQAKESSKFSCQLVRSRSFRQKFRYILQNTRYQKGNIALLLFKFSNMSALENEIGQELVLKMMKHILLRFSKFCRKNDLMARIERDIIALLLLNAPDDQAVAVAEKMIFALKKMKFTFQGNRFSAKGKIGIASCNMDDTAETIIRKALLAVEIGEMKDATPIITEKDIPPDFMDTLYSL